MRGQRAADEQREAGADAAALGRNRDSDAGRTEADSIPVIRCPCELKQNLGDIGGAVLQPGDDDLQ